MEILVLLFHPNLAQSRVNRRLAQAADKEEKRT